KIIDAFSVEKVTKEFYQEIANWYFWAIKKLKFPDDAEKDENGRNIATIRLITRLIFIWFMKVRKLIPDELFDENSLKNILKSFKLNDTNYYKAILQNLFFATLNTKQNERRFTSKKKGYKGFSTDFGNHNVYRYEDLFKNSEEAIEKYFMPIPFLNGGLFECLDYKSKIKDERMYIDGFTSTKGKQPIIPNELFFADEKQVDLNKDYGTSNKKYNVRGLIKILSQYNFTIDENDPNDAEVALDPELLGKVFENLLASYNPETANTARKSTGSYYTPRPIVDYMVDESLKQYFRTFLEQGTDNIPVVGNTPVSKDAHGTLSVSRDAHGTFFNPYDEVDIHINNLPHWQQKDVWYFVTFRLNDSIPRETLEQIKREREQWLTKHKKNYNQPYSKEELKEYYRLFSERIENLLDDCKGSCVLKEERIAKIVADALLYFNNKKYILDDWVIMPNHVHILVKPINGYTLPEITHSWKSFTANEINKILGKKGQFWLHESYDHIVRNETAFNAIKNYIRNNPVKANLNLPACAQSWTQGTDNIPVVGNTATPVSKDAHGTFESKDALDTLFDENTDNPFDAATTEKLVGLIDSLRAVDPAVGSGAFPMRLLNRLVFLLHKLDPNNELWKKSQIEGIKKSVKDPVLQRKFIEQIEKKFNEKNPDYGRKLYLIEKCIYGVDIQQIAVEIAKLRFFISLLVDEKIDFEKPEENYGIEPLPNLDFKLMQGNSLISSFAGIDFNRKQDDGDKLFSFDDNYKKLIEEFEELKSQYQNEPEVEAKRKLKEDIDKKLIEIFEEKLNQHFPQLQTINEKAAHIPNKEQRKEYIEKEKKNLFKKIGIDLEQVEKDLIAYTEGRKQKNFFLWDVYFAEVFTEKGGFDIVIGNPPYIQLQKNHGELSKLYKDKGYKTFDSMGDIYCLFYEKGINLLREHGHLCYITSNKWMRAGYGDVLREYFTKYNPKILIDLGPGIFESATVDTNILLIQKSKVTELFDKGKKIVGSELRNRDASGTLGEINDDKQRSRDASYTLRALTLAKESNIDFNKQLIEKGVTLTKLTKDAWFIGSNAEQQLKEKIERIGKPLKDWDVNIYYGIKTGLNEAFIITIEKRNEILKNCKDEEERKRTEAIIKPILRGRDIKRYYYDWAGLWVIGTFPALHLNIENFPALKKYFLDNFDIRQLEQSGKKYPKLSFNARKKTGNKWFETQDQIAYYPEFEKEKVVYGQFQDAAEYSYCEAGVYLSSNEYMIGGNYHRKYFLGLLNSKLIEWYLNSITGVLGSGMKIGQKSNFEKIPLPHITSINQHIVLQIEALVDQILSVKKANPKADTIEWEREIDRLVYQLYELTEEEIKIIEGAGYG
ncbi:MAG: TaqI-like C-terminal specificity domain-containing protein, partial [Candidatus Aenigmatarchaeota archaeon]